MRAVDAARRREADDAVSALRKLEAASQVKPSLMQYNQLVIEAKARVNEASAVLPDGELKQELNAAVDRGDSDSAITQFFVQTYGTLVLAAPPNRGFNRVAWIMPYLALPVGITLVVFIVWM